MGKRSKNGDGTSYQMADGRWGAAAYYTDEKGDRKRKNFTAKTKDGATEKMQNWLKANHAFDEEPTPVAIDEFTLLGEFVQEFKVK